ncbi:hypothetical protein QQS21_007652 [Conoideocrella luteorostrata]|uniref:Uncharacterized protein n=1 Tax=Conoideocrella luteorostrata TaxID=1105319 RepID=A0AAJ0FZA3_9HYPO|nr:hypothetical protein QQS21_007652 [Conoideocrella luteorostrata]
MVQCACGRSFGSDKALAQHRDAKLRNGQSCGDGIARTTKPPWSKRWFWLGVRTKKRPIITVRSDALTASSTPVSSTADCELICTYNWQECDGTKIYIPGHAPYWHDNILPFAVQEDKGSYFVDQDAARIPKHPFEPVFRASAVLNPNFRFHNVDVVVNRNSLRKLLDFCGGHVKDSFKVNLLIVENTLFIERCEKNARQLIRGSSRSGWGHNFERAFTRCHPAAGADDSSGHHRVLCYPIGDLRCAVRFEVDACYDVNAAEEAHHTEPLLLEFGALSLEGGSGSATGKMSLPTTMPQSTAAELKSTQKPKPVGMYLPQLWFGRTPWLIVGTHTKGVFHSVKVTDAAASFQQWETKHQHALQKMATLLHELREAVRKNKGRSCAAICEKATGPAVIKVFETIERNRALPEDLIAQFWCST